MHISPQISSKHPQDRNAHGMENLNITKIDTINMSFELFIKYIISAKLFDLYRLRSSVWIL